MPADFDGAGAYVKSPVASLCLACSSVRNRVKVTMCVLTFSISELPFPVDAILIIFSDLSQLTVFKGRSRCLGSQPGEVSDGGARGVARAVTGVEPTGY